jgi:hypothetical protein
MQELDPVTLARVLVWICAAGLGSTVSLVLAAWNSV